MTLICTKPKQVEVWVKDTNDQCEFWKGVLHSGTYHMFDKTEEEAQALASYFEGKYDMAVQFTEILRNINSETKEE